MNSEQREFLNQTHFSGVLDDQQASWLLGFTVVEVGILSRAGRLTPLGNPKKNAKKVFATIEIKRCIQDMEWLNRAQKTITEFWEKKNRSRRANSPLASEVAEAPANLVARKHSRHTTKVSARTTNGSCDREPR